MELAGRTGISAWRIVLALLRPWPSARALQIRRQLESALLFDADWYRDEHREHFGARYNALRHYVLVGSRLGWSTNPLIDVEWYRRQNPQIGADDDPVAHFLLHGGNAGRSPHPLFDAAWYLNRYPDVVASRINPLAHYLSSGWRELRNPHPLFEPQHYLTVNPDIDPSINPLIHYIRRGGVEARSPHPLFDSAYYVATIPAGAVRGISPLVHYLTSGWRDGYSPHRLFDVRYYLQMNPGVASAGIEPLTHYLTEGWRDRRNPHPLFDVEYYLRKNPDVAAAGIEPLTHYLTSGWRDRHDPHPLFDIEYYLLQNPDVAAAEIEPLTHYLTTGWRDRRSPHPLFDPRYYLDANPDVAVADVDPLIDFLRDGASKRRAPHLLFDTAWYLDRNSDVAAAGLNPLSHYLTVGWREGRNPHPLFDNAYYLAMRRDVASSGVNPLVHYVLFGGREEGSSHWMFDTKYYLATNPDIDQTKINPLAHFLTIGAASGRDPNPLLDISDRKTAEAGPGALNPLADYLQSHAQFNRAVVTRADLFNPEPGRADLPTRPRRPAAQPGSILLSVLLEVGEVTARDLARAIEGLRAQTYEHWELVIVVSSEAGTEARERVCEYAQLDARIRIAHAAGAADGRTTMADALSRARGQYVTVLSFADELLTSALQEVAALIDDHGQVQVVYTDHDDVTPAGRVVRRNRKPDWSPLLLQSLPYVDPLLVLRRTLAQEIGGHPAALTGDVDPELLLRLAERELDVRHVRKSVCRRRTRAPHGDDREPDASSREARIDAVNRHFDRTNFAATAKAHPFEAIQTAIVPKAPVPDEPILAILRGDRPVEIVRAALRALGETANGCLEPVVLRWGAHAELAGEPGRVFSANVVCSRRGIADALVSAIARAADRRFILLLDPVVRFDDPGWLEHLLLYAKRASTGFVSTTLRDPAGLIVASGLAVDGCRGAVPALRGCRWGRGNVSLHPTREVSAVDGTLAMFDRDLVDRLGGVDPSFAGLFYAIADLSYRATLRGRTSVVVEQPLATVPTDCDIGSEASEIDRQLFLEKHRDTLDAHDRFQYDPVNDMA